MDVAPILADPGIEPAAPSAATSRTLINRIPPIGVLFGAAWLLAVVVLAVFADQLPFVRHYAQQVGGAANFEYGPGNDFWFGSDRLGRDVFARCVYGARISLTIAATSIVIGLLVGGTLGTIAGYFRGRIDRVVSILVDSLLAFPAIVVAALMVGRFRELRDSDITFLGIGFGWASPAWALVIVFSLLSVAPVARIVRAQTLSLTQREYVLAARSLGARTGRVLLREIVPNLVPALVSVIFTGIAILLAAEGGLAFLGYSVEPPQASWGLMIAEGREFIDPNWWATLFPCMMLFLTVLSFNLLGTHLARRFDIREAAL